MNVPQPQFRTGGGMTFSSQTPPIIVYSASEIARDFVTPGSPVWCETTGTRYRVGKMQLISGSVYQIFLVEDPLTEEV